jgi:hypothetical protein
MTSLDPDAAPTPSTSTAGRSTSHEPVRVSRLPLIFGSLRSVQLRGEVQDKLCVMRIRVQFTMGQGRRSCTYKDHDGCMQLCVDGPEQGMPTKGTGREISEQLDLDRFMGWIKTCI